MSGLLSSHRNGMVWYGMVNVDLYSAIITKVSNAPNALVSGEKPGFQALSKGLIVLLCAEVSGKEFQTMGPCIEISITVQQLSWWRGTVVERRSLAGELSLSCARPAADG